MPSFAIGQRALYPLVGATVLFLALGSAFLRHRAQADPVKAPVKTSATASSHYDSALTPITAEKVRTEIKAHRNDAVALFQLIRQASVSQQHHASLQVLSELRQQEKTNATVLAAYCLAFDLAEQSRTPLGFQITPEQQEARDSGIETACQLEPTLWLPYAVQGYYLADKPEQEAEALRLLTKAETLAPNLSITHYLLSDFYSVLTPLTSPAKAVKEAEKAQTLQPVLSKAPRLLLFIYTYVSPDKQKALAAKAAYLKTVPPGMKLDSTTQNLLARTTVR